MQVKKVPISTTTKVSSSSTRSMTLPNNFCTSFPDSENQRENNERHNRRTHRCDSRTESFCASALQSEVFPVPGGPCKSTTRFQDTMLTMGICVNASRAMDQTYSQHRHR